MSPNRPDLNPVDYKIWEVMQQRVYEMQIHNVDESSSDWLAFGAVCSKVLSTLLSALTHIFQRLQSCKWAWSRDPLSKDFDQSVFPDMSNVVYKLSEINSIQKNVSL